MTRTFSLLCLTAALTGGCGGDGDSDNDKADAGGNKVDASRDGDGGGKLTELPTDPTMCGADDNGDVLDTTAAGGCYYFYCTYTEARVKAEAKAGGACSSDRDVEVQCEGASVRVVTECGKTHSGLAGDKPAFEKAVTECARPKPELEGFSDGCLACNVKSASCITKDFDCVVKCATGGNSRACDECRQKIGCTPGFYDCAGLPDPLK